MSLGQVFEDTFSHQRYNQDRYHFFGAVPVTLHGHRNSHVARGDYLNLAAFFYFPISDERQFKMIHGFDASLREAGFQTAGLFELMASHPRWLRGDGFYDHLGKRRSLLYHYQLSSSPFPKGAWVVTLNALSYQLGLEGILFPLLGQRGIFYAYCRSRMPIQARSGTVIQTSFKCRMYQKARCLPFEEYTKRHMITVT